jgi:hypothetical protein
MYNNYIHVYEENISHSEVIYLNLLLHKSTPVRGYWFINCFPQNHDALTLRCENEVFIYSIEKKIVISCIFNEFVFLNRMLAWDLWEKLPGKLSPTHYGRLCLEVCQCKPCDRVLGCLAHTEQTDRTNKVTTHTERTHSSSSRKISTYMGMILWNHFSNFKF